MDITLTIALISSVAFAMTLYIVAKVKIDLLDLRANFLIINTHLAQRARELNGLNDPAYLIARDRIINYGYFAAGLSQRLLSIADRHEVEDVPECRSVNEKLQKEIDEALNLARHAMTLYYLNRTLSGRLHYLKMKRELVEQEVSKEIAQAIAPLPRPRSRQEPVVTHNRVCVP